MPKLNGEFYAPCMPKWFANFLRIITASFCVVIVLFSIQDWTGMPLGFRILVCILNPVLLLLAFHPRGLKAWSTIPFFQADSLGMYFRSGGAYIVIKGRVSKEEWLYVPWESISDIRLAPVASSDGTSIGAVFDVDASPEEVAKFFYEGVSDNHSPRDGRVSVAFYVNTPPSPREVVNTLINLANRYHVSLQ